MPSKAGGYFHFVSGCVTKRMLALDRRDRDGEN